AAAAAAALPGQIPVDAARVLPAFRAALLNCYAFPPRPRAPRAAVCEVLTETDAHSHIALLYSPDTAALAFYEASSHEFSITAGGSAQYRTHVFDDPSAPTKQMQIHIPDASAGDDLPAPVHLVQLSPTRACLPSLDLGHEYIPLHHDRSTVSCSQVLDVLPRDDLLKQSILDIDPDFTSTFTRFVHIQDPSPFALLRVLVAEDVFLGIRFLHTAYLFAILYGESAKAISILPDKQLHDPQYRNWDIASMVRISHSSYDLLGYSPLPSQPPSTSLFPKKLLQWESEHASIILNVEPPVSRLSLYEKSSDSSRIVDIKYIISDPKDLIPVAIDFGNTFNLLLPRTTVSPRQLYEMK
ncbi:hypothetical protein NEOLI_005458, partial [Neolecta irregularis DAH-3]